jgi:hypothetical protein
MVSAKALEQIFYQKPFAPFIIRTTDGEEVTVRKPRRASVSGPQVALIGVSRRNGGIGVERLRIIAIDRIESAQPVGRDS